MNQNQLFEPNGNQTFNSMCQSYCTNAANNKNPAVLNLKLSYPDSQNQTQQPTKSNSSNHTRSVSNLHLINYNTQISSEGTGNFNAAINHASNHNLNQNIFESNLKQGRIRSKNQINRNSVGDGSSVIYKSMDTRALGNQSMDSTTNGTQRLKTRI